MNAVPGSSSKPKQRTRKGKQRDVSVEPTASDATSAQVEDAPQKSKTRRRGDNQIQARQRDSIITQTTQSGVDPQPPPAQPSKGARPRARRINKEGTQTSLNPVLQSQSQLQPAVPEPAASGTVGSAHTSPSEVHDTTDGPSGAAPLPARKRRHTATRDELNSGNKKRKTLDQRHAKATKEKTNSLCADIVEKGNDT
jgi:hypothetical protein